MFYLYIISCTGQLALIHFLEKNFFTLAVFEGFCSNAFTESASLELLVLSTEGFFCKIGSRSASLIRITRSSEISFNDRKIS